MFDLFRSRDKAVRLMLGGLLVLVAFSMLIYLIPGAGMPNPGSNSEVVAEIGKEEVTTKDIQELIQERTQSRQVPPEMMQYLLPQLIDQRINDIAVAYQAQRMGFVVTDADLANAIRSMPNIGNLPADQYRATVEQLGMSVPEFEANLRKKMEILHLQDVVLQGVVVTPKEVQEEYDRRNEKIKLDYIAFDPAKLKSEIKPTNEQVQAFYNSSKGFFTVPEARNVALVVADPQILAQSLQIPEGQEQQFYNSHKDQFRTPERVNVRHILLMTTGKSKEETEKIRLRAEDLLKQLKGGADFAKLATQFSEDPGSKGKGGDLGWVVRGQTVKNFEAAAFSLKPKELSPVITTEYGFHIIQVLEKQDARLQPFDEVKVQIADELKKGMINDRTQNLADQAHSEIAKAPNNAEQIATKLGLSFGKADNVKPGGALPFVGADKEVSAAVGSMRAGEVSPLLQAGNRLVIAIVTGVTPSHPAQFDEVEAQVRDRYAVDAVTKMIAEKSKQAAEMLKSNGGDLKAVAKSFGLEVKSTDLFDRQGAAEGLGAASYFGDVFEKPVGYVTGAVNVGAQTVVAKLAEKQAADPSKLSGQREQILMQLKSKKADERNNLFEDSIMEKLLAEGKVKIHRDVINRILARYRKA